MSFTAFLIGALSCAVVCTKTRAEESLTPVIGFADSACHAASAICGVKYPHRIFPGDEFNLKEGCPLPKCVQTCVQHKDCVGINYRELNGIMYCSLLRDSLLESKLGLESLINETNSIYIDEIEPEPKSDIDHVVRRRDTVSVRLSEDQMSNLWCPRGEKWLSCDQMECPKGPAKVAKERTCSGKRKYRGHLECACEPGLFRREHDWNCVIREECDKTSKECPDPNDIALLDDECVFEDVCESNGPIVCGIFQRCVCKRGYYRNENGQCEQLDDCENNVEKVEVECGKPPIEPIVGSQTSRIIGGTAALPYSWPWQVYFERGCGGALIAEDKILTAGHCVSRFEPRLKAVIGSYLRLKNNEQGEEIIKVAEVQRHPQFNLRSLYNDIAILRLKTPVKFDDTKQPICMPSSELEDYTKMWVTGWGTQSPVFIVEPNSLQQVSVSLVPHDACKVYYDGDLLGETQLCASAPGKDTCQGDSGGPLVHKVGGAWELHGIVSWGEGCALQHKPGVYTKVSYYADWIEKTIKDMDSRKN